VIIFISSAFCHLVGVLGHASLGQYLITGPHGAVPDNTLAWVLGGGSRASFVVYSGAILKSGAGSLDLQGSEIIE